MGRSVFHKYVLVAFHKKIWCEIKING
jgi:hypothetical protein